MNRTAQGGLGAFGNLEAMFDHAAFRDEQARLGKVWNCVGRVMDLTEDNAWIRTRLGGRSIFIQRFGDKLRGFENRCAHRSFPLRTEDRGQGPVVCGFHHWRYDADGLARGIPKCTEMYGKSPRELNARLQPVDVETCGGLVFARFPSEQSGPGLRAYLGASYDIVAALTAPGPYQRAFKNEVKANWRLLAHISLDDYHIVAVHPSTFGGSGYLKPDEIQYYRDGRHSAFFEGERLETIEEMAEGCRSGTYVPRDYRTLNFFPNLGLAQQHVLSFAGVSVWYVAVSYYIPTAADRTELHVILQPSPFSIKGTGLRRFGHDKLEWLRSLIVGYYTRKIIAEDNVACEMLQTNAEVLRHTPLLAAQEERVAWFEETYRKHVL
jgi:phenylpropionate dioxygenase-like ring-hydroxylating dioxygenase large terminal subunit